MKKNRSDLVFCVFGPKNECCDGHFFGFPSWREVERGRRAKTRPRRRRPRALLRRRTPLLFTSQEVFLPSSKPGRADVNLFTFLAQKTRFRGSFLNIMKLDRLSCATRYVLLITLMENRRISQKIALLSECQNRFFSVYFDKSISVSVYTFL